MCCDRLDPWEPNQNEWTATLTVMQHFQELFECESSKSAECDNVAVKKRKIDANNKNYIVAGKLDVSIVIMTLARPVPVVEWWSTMDHSLQCVLVLTG